MEGQDCLSIRKTAKTTMLSDAVSIWRLPALRLIIQLPGMRQVHVAQGLFGAQSPKPTTLLSLGVATSNIGKRPSLWYVDYDASAQRFSRPR